MDEERALFVGLMSGTSVDGIDCALVDCGGDVTLLATHTHPFPEATSAQVATLSQPGNDEISRLGELDRELGCLFAQATLELLSQAGVDPHAVRAIGSHGQTIRHGPPRERRATGGLGYTLQIGDPNTIVEHTGITTVADFRRRDIAAGGEGAPLAPAFHAAVFGRQGVNRAIVNIGGISNVTLLRGRELVAGFDSGPGNTLLDHWVARHRGAGFDDGGCWAAGGKLLPGLLEDCLAEPYFTRCGPRSTGRELFNLAWLDGRLSRHGDAAPRDVQATLAELTAAAISKSISESHVAVDEVFVCGGGSRNTHLMARLAALLAPLPVADTGSLGLAPEWVEAAAFAWLAHRCLAGLAGNAPAVTGAQGNRILGGIYLP